MFLTPSRRDQDGVWLCDWCDQPATLQGTVTCDDCGDTAAAMSAAAELARAQAELARAEAYQLLSAAIEAGQSPEPELLEQARAVLAAAVEQDTAAAVDDVRAGEHRAAHTHPRFACDSHHDRLGGGSA